MPKSVTKFVCDECGGEQSRWIGRCPFCGQFNTLKEFKIKQVLPGGAGAAKSVKGASAALPVSDGPKRLRDVLPVANKGHIPTNIEELDRVLGGGIVSGGMILLGGDPGIGKSTLLLQICKQMASKDYKVLYVSGEESESQIKMRADRLQVDAEGCYLLSETEASVIKDAAEKVQPQLLFVDSIQTMRIEDITSLPGSVTQVRECAAFFTTLAKQNNMAVVLVGHVTKEGALAGPRVLEHMVDTVLYFEGEGKDSYRIIRSAKNRFGSTHEIGVFEMTERGLTGIADPSAYMLAGRPLNISGSAVICSMEGTRPLLTEVQALVTNTQFPVARRTSTGFDYNRMVMLMAVLEKRAGFRLADKDAYINIAGGLKIDEPATDAGIVAALASCYRDKALNPQLMVMGEVGLAGELRAITHPERRIQEAMRQGFTSCVMPLANKAKIKIPQGFKVYGAENISEMLNAIL